MPALFAVWIGLLASGPTPTPSPSATPTPRPRLRLRLDVDRHVDALLNPTVPRFHVEVTTRTPQQAFEEHLLGFNTACGPSGAGAPTVAEMAPHRPGMPEGAAPFIPTVDVLKLIADLKKIGPDRYFLYRVTRADGVRYLVNEGRLPWAQLIQPGATLEPIAAFPDRATATRAWRRLERGYRTPVYAPPPACAGAPKP